jgi:arylsulfatase A-like enzyme
MLNDSYFDETVEKLGNHSPIGTLRGGKYSLYEAGCLIPFFTYLKSKIESQVSDALVCQIDLLESLSKLVGADVKPTDSENLLDVFMGKSKKKRENLVINANIKNCIP